MTLPAPLFRASVARATKFARKEEPATSSSQRVIPSFPIRGVCSEGVRCRGSGEETKNHEASNNSAHFFPPELRGMNADDPYRKMKARCLPFASLAATVREVQKTEAFIRMGMFGARLSGSVGNNRSRRHADKCQNEAATLKRLRKTLDGSRTLCFWLEGISWADDAMAVRGCGITMRVVPPYSTTVA